MSPLFLILAVVLTSVVIFVNVLLFHALIKRAIKFFIEPTLINKGLTYQSYKWAGMFTKGDFDTGDSDFIALGKTGLHSLSVYAFIYYKDEKLDINKRVTVKIDVDTWGNSIEKVIYSAEL